MLESYYLEIDEFPLYNWIKCNDGKMKFVRKGKLGFSFLDKLYWIKLYDNYLAKFGLEKKYNKYLNLLKERALLQLDYIKTRDRFILTLIEIKDSDIKSLEAQFGSGQSIEVILSWLSKFMGYKINQKETTVVEYFTLLEQYGRANKEK